MDEFLGHAMFFAVMNHACNEEISELASIEDDVERVRRIEDTVFYKAQYEQATKCLENLNKSLVQADSFREKGNRRYAKGDLVQALELFNASICFAPKGSVQLSKAYSNRSAVYFSMKSYELCMKNIQMAKETGYPMNLMSKLDEREAKCKTELKKPENQSSSKFIGIKPELSYPMHKNVPFIVNCLELNVNRRYGRHIVTNTNLKVGDIVAIERPFCGVVTRDIRYTCCAYCLNENNMDLFPCEKCHSVMFCSAECYAEAMKSFHDIECPITNVLFESNLLESKDNVALRLLILAVKSFKSPDELIQFVKNLENREQNVFTANFEKTQNIDLLASILKLERHEKKPMLVGSTSVTVALLRRILLDLTDLKEVFKTKEQIDFLINLCFRLCQIANLNSLHVTSMRRNGFRMAEHTEVDSSGAAFGIYPFISLLNHSCSPNVVRAKHGLRNVVIIMKPIEKGGQLFDCYGMHHRHNQRKTRQNKLREKFLFRCQCEACIRNYPSLLIQRLYQGNDFIKPFLHMVLTNEHKLDVIKQLIPEYCAFLNAKSTNNYPKNQTDIAEEILLGFWNVIYAEDISFARKHQLTQSNSIADSLM